ncbi:LPD7 domain-containing protein [Cupriavidus sp. CP313]
MDVPYGERQIARKLGAKWDGKRWSVGPNADPEKLRRWFPDNGAAIDAPGLSPEVQFADALRTMDCVVDGEHPIMDGQKHRIATVGDKGTEKSGFYVGHLDNPPAGYIKNNRSGLEMRWKAKRQTHESAAPGISREEVERKREAAQANAETHEVTAERVARRLSRLILPAQPTPYLVSKGVPINQGVLTDRDGRTTYVPAYDVTGKVWTLQTIAEDGTKRFAADGRIEGCFHVVGGLANLASAPALVIGEGYATMASLSGALGYPTVATFNSGNLLPVARALREAFPDRPIVVAGDDDLATKAEIGINPGRKYAEAAGAAVGGLVIFPKFAPGEQSPDSKDFTDFNDLATKSAVGAAGMAEQVRRQVGAWITRHQQRHRPAVAETTPKGPNMDAPNASQPESADTTDQPIERGQLAAELERIDRRITSAASGQDAGLAAQEREQAIAVIEAAMQVRDVDIEGDDPAARAADRMLEPHQMAAMSAARALALHDSPEAPNPFAHEQLQRAYEHERAFAAQQKGAEPAPADATPAEDSPATDVPEVAMQARPDQAADQLAPARGTTDTGDQLTLVPIEGDTQATGSVEPATIVPTLAPATVRVENSIEGVAQVDVEMPAPPAPASQAAKNAPDAPNVGPWRAALSKVFTFKPVAPASVLVTPTAPSPAPGAAASVVAGGNVSRAPASRQGGKAKMVLTKTGYDVPAGVASRYVVQEGKFWLAAGGDPSKTQHTDPHFEDKGPRLATGSDDRTIAADMVAVAQAKGWSTVSLTGTEDFRRNAWIEAGLAGLETKGFAPNERDLATLEVARRERDTLRISAGQERAPAPPENTVTAEAPARERTPEPAPVPPIGLDQLRESLKVAMVASGVPEAAQQTALDRLPLLVAVGREAETDLAARGEVTAPALQAAIATRLEQAPRPSMEPFAPAAPVAPQPERTPPQHAKPEPQHAR